jgi:hypothetical protein
LNIYRFEDIEVVGKFAMFDMGVVEYLKWNNSVWNEMNEPRQKHWTFGVKAHNSTCPTHSYANCSTTTTYMMT